MNPSVAMKLVLVFGPVFLLVLMGLAITLRSGVVHLASGQGLRRMAGNLSHTAIALIACVIALVAIQEAVGLRVHFGW